MCQNCNPPPPTHTVLHIHTHATIDSNQVIHLTLCKQGLALLFSIPIFCTSHNDAASALVSKALNGIVGWDQM